MVSLTTITSRISPCLTSQFLVRSPVFMTLAPTPDQRTPSQSLAQQRGALRAHHKAPGSSATDGAIVDAASPSRPRPLSTQRPLSHCQRKGPASQGTPSLGQGWGCLPILSCPLRALRPCAEGLYPAPQGPGSQVLPAAASTWTRPQARGQAGCRFPFTPLLRLMTPDGGPTHLHPKGAATFDHASGHRSDTQG